MANPRVSRGRETEDIFAEYLREHGWPGARRQPASLPGRDILDCRLLAPEVKATTAIPLLSALKQAQKNAEVFDLERNHDPRLPDGRGFPSLPFVVWRPNGYGKANIDHWVLALTVKNGVELLQKAGY